MGFQSSPAFELICLPVCTVEDVVEECNVVSIFLAASLPVCLQCSSVMLESSAERFYW